MEPMVSSAEKPNPAGGFSRVRRQRHANVCFLGTPAQTVITLAAACVAPILYLIFVDRYASNSFFGDDWSAAPLIHSALSGHLTMGLLWSQYHESRLFWQRIIDVLFGNMNRFDLRSVIFVSAAVLIAAYAVLLALFHRYLGSRLTPIPVLVIGAIWFSLADVENALGRTRLRGI